MNEVALKHIQEEQEKQTGKLDLTGLNLMAIPKEIAEMTWLKELYLHNNQISKVEGLEGLSRLIALSLYGNQIQKLEGLEGLSSLTRLYVHQNQISKLEGLEHLNRLSSFYFHSNQISKLEGLEHLSSLEMLNFRNNQITNLKGLGHLSRLSVLNIHSNPIQTLEGLEKLVGLKMLSFGNEALKISFEASLLEKIPVLDLKGLVIKDLDLFSSRISKGEPVFEDIPRLKIGKSDDPADVNFLFEDVEFYCKKGIYIIGIRCIIT